MALDKIASLNSITARQSAPDVEPEQDLLQSIEQALPLCADLSRADATLFVQEGREAVVVAEARPRSIASLRRTDLIGNRYPLSESPLLVVALEEGRRGQRQIKLPDQGTTVVQQVFPVPADGDGPGAALQLDTSLLAWERQKRRHRSFRQAVGWLQEMVLRGDLRGAAGLGRFSEWDGVLFVDETFHIRYLSGIANNLYRRLGYLEDLHGKHVGDLQTHDELLVRQAFETLACRGHEVKEGSRHWTRMVVPVWSYSPNWWPLPRSRHKPALRGALITVHDGTDDLRKAQELKVLATMIREVHHRVKNNLQTVASVLRMQARRTENLETRDHLAEAVNRILAVAVIHEFLSQGSEQAINIREVCQRIVTQTQRAAMQPDTRIALRIDGPAIYLPSQQATACALVANELVLNALEHAFDGHADGHIFVQLADEGDRVVMEVRDDGSGLPATFDPGGEDSLGLSIVRTLVEGDLRGQFVLEPVYPGTRALVTFPKGNLNLD